MNSRDTHPRRLGRSLALPTDHSSSPDNQKFLALERCACKAFGSSALARASGTVAKPLQHGAARSRTRSEEPTKKGHLPLPAPECNPVQMAQMPPLGLEEGQQSSGKTTLPVNHCAPPGAQDLDPEQLAAQLRGLDRSELEQLLLTLLSKAESGPE